MRLKKLSKQAVQELLIHCLLGALSLAWFGSCKTGIDKNENAEASSKILQPNVILVVTDDQGYGDLGYHGNPWLKTPHLDAFAIESLELTNFHVGSTCTPTRAGLMTGRNANRNNAWHTIAGCSILLKSEEVIAEVFANNGYQTAMFGKWHLGDNFPYRPHDRGFQTTLYHGGGGIGQTPDFWGNDYFDDTYLRNGVPEKFSGYCTDVWFDQAIQYIEARNAKPFFLYLATNAAHGPFNVPPKYQEMYEDAPLTEIQKRFYGMNTNTDENFGKLINYLDSEGLANNTIVIFTTDNGTARGIVHLKEEDQWVGYNAGLRGTKGSHYDGGHRVPFFIRWPQGEILQGTKISELAAHVDLLPTLADLANLDYVPKKALDGISLKSLLTGTIDSLDRMLVIDTQRQQWPEKNRNSCVMSTEWRLVNGSELYNTNDDPGQTQNVADQHPDQVKRMKEYYDNWWLTLEPDIKHAYIPIGTAEDNPVLLTIHDFHTDEQLPWNQGMIRNAQANPDGHYTVSLKQSGEYKIKMSRYPPEASLAIGEQAIAEESTKYRDGFPEGVSIKVIKAVITLNGVSYEVSVNDSDPYAVWQGALSQGDYKMKSVFITNTGKVVPVYYQQFELL